MAIHPSLPSTTPNPGIILKSSALYFWKGPGPINYLFLNWEQFEVSLLKVYVFSTLNSSIKFSVSDFFHFCKAETIRKINSMSEGGKKKTPYID